MRKALGLLAAGVLALSLAAPVSAAPVENPQMEQWLVTCGGDLGTFTIFAKGLPAWPIDLEPGTTPIIVRSAIWNIWQDGQIVASVPQPAPKGLVGKLVGPCTLDQVAGDPETFAIQAVDAFLQLP